MSESPAANIDLPTLNRELNQAWEAAGLTPEGLFPFELALEEVFVNAITHGAQAGQIRHFELAFSYANGRAALVLRDDAPAFDPLSLATPDLDADLEERSVGGLGIHLVRELMDEVTYRRTEGCNELTLAKHID
jgi:anti-sigma regulatory factor (Ser/Thr protein kinase)